MDQGIKMLFQVINDKGITTMSTEYESCIPDDSQLSSMSKAGYKFRIDGKTASVKRVKEVRDNV